MGQQATKTMVKLAAPFTKLHSGWKTVLGYWTAQELEKWQPVKQKGGREGKKSTGPKG